MLRLQLFLHISTLFLEFQKEGTELFWKASISIRTGYLGLNAIDSSLAHTNHVVRVQLCYKSHS